MAVPPPLPAGSPDIVPIISLDSITLRPITFDDADFVAASATDPQVRKISSVPQVVTPESARAFIERQHQRLAEGAGYALVIEPHERVGMTAAVGHIGLWFRQFAEFNHLTLGYWSIESARGRGYMSQAVRGLSDWGFESIECDRHRLWIEEWNVASQKTGERAGFMHQPQVRAIEELHGASVEVLAWDRARPTP